MEQVIPGVHASAPRPLPFATSTAMRGFLCRRGAGNLLIYGATGLERERTVIDALGGVARHYLNHRHEAEFLPTRPLGPVFVHERDGDAVPSRANPHETFSGRHHIDDDFEVIPAPGHTPGATVYLWDSGKHRILFSGDTIYLSEGEWVAAVLESSDRAAYLASLELIRELDFDVLVPWIATGGLPCCAHTDSVDARRRVGAIVERLERGASR
jgi:hypothetical protein